MTARWRQCMLGDILELKRGYDLPSTERRKGAVPVVSSSGVTGWHDEAKAKAPGVVTGRYGTLGEVHYVTTDYWPLNTTLYVCDFKDNHPRFISYFLRSINFQAANDKSSVPGLNRNDLHKYRILIPPRSEQEAIASVLGSLDDKIEQNRRTALTLEQLARAIFKAWFVDFEPVKAKAAGAASFPSMPQDAFDSLPVDFIDSQAGPIPEGTRLTPLSSIATFLNGLALQRYPPRGDGNDLPVVKIAQLRKGSAEGSTMANDDVPSSHVIDDHDMLFSWSGTLEATLWFGGRGALNQHIFKVTSEEFPKWFCLLWIRHFLPWFRAIAASKATTMGHIRRSHLDEAMVPVPPEGTLAAANEIIAPLYDLYAQLQVESRALASMRDVLLPALLSGSVRIAEPEALSQEPAT